MKMKDNAVLYILAKALYRSLSDNLQVVDELLFCQAYEISRQIIVHEPITLYEAINRLDLN